MLDVLLIIFGTCATIGAIRGLVEGAWLGWREGVRTGIKTFCDLIVSLAVMLGLYTIVRGALILR